MSVDKMSVDKMSVDKMSVDKMSVDKMSVDRMSCRSTSVMLFKSFNFFKKTLNAPIQKDPV
jgi:hypothetical protein